MRQANASKSPRKQLLVSIENSSIAVTGIRARFYSSLKEKAEVRVYVLRDDENGKREEKGKMYEPMSICSVLHLIVASLRHRVIILTFTLRPLILGYTISALTGSRYVPTITGTGPLFSSRHIFYRIARIVYPAILRSAEAVFCHNNDDAKILSSFKNGIAIKVVGGSGIDVAESAPSRLSYKFKTTPIKIALFSRLLVDKGVREYLEATSRLMEEFPWMKGDILLAGLYWGANLKANCIKKDEIEIWSKKGGVFIGQPSNKQEFYESVDILCVASYREGLSNVLLEGANSGCILVASEVAGCMDVLGNDAGLTFQPKSSIDLYRVLIEALHLNQTSQENFRALARDRLIKRFSKEEVIAHYFRVLGL